MFDSDIDSDIEIEQQIDKYQKINPKNKENNIFIEIASKLDDDDNSKKIIEIIKNNKIPIDYKNPYFLICGIYHFLNINKENIFELSYGIFNKIIIHDDLMLKYYQNRNNSINIENEVKLDIFRYYRYVDIMLSNKKNILEIEKYTFSYFNTKNDENDDDSNSSSDSSDYDSDNY